MDILYFAWVREQIGIAQEQVTPPPGVSTVGDLISWLAGRGAGHAAAFADPSRLRAAVDQEFASFDTIIAGAREIAIFPPVTGG